MKTPINNNKDELHPQDKRNLILFIIISLVLWLAFDQLLLKPRVDEMRIAQEKEAAIAQKQAADMGIDVVDLHAKRPRADVIGETKRLPFKNDKIFGSVSLKGGRLDDVSLYNHYKTLDKKENVELFSPAGTEDPEYADFGWLSKDKNLRIPTKDTVWSVQGNSNLTPQTPVTLSWDNGQGLRFERIIGIDDNFMFNIKRRVINNTGHSVTLFPYSLVSQHGFPSDFFNRWIVHEGPIAYLNDELQEYSYKKMVKTKDISFRANEGWTGLSDHYWMTALIPESGNEMKYKFTYTLFGIYFNRIATSC